MCSSDLFNGIPTRTKLQKLVHQGHIREDQVNAVYDLKQKKTIEVIEACAKYRPEKVELLKWLKDKNIRLACFTNSIRETTTLMLDKTGILEFFEMITTNQDVTSPKPNPEGYILTLKNFKIPADNTIIVEDSPKGLQAAHATDCHVLEVSNPDEVNIELFKELIR